MKYAIFLSGPIGAGKTTLGRALGERIGGAFIDGDDHSDPGRPWYCSILRTSTATLRAGLARLHDKPAIVVAYPLNCMTWIYFRRKFEGVGVQPLFVSLRASFPAITGQNRGRSFSREEKERIQVMIAEGYGSRPFSDLVVDTDGPDFAATLVRLEAEVRRLMRNPPLQPPP
jgi:hypothetical protein